MINQTRAQQIDTTALRDAWPITRVLQSRGIETQKRPDGWRSTCPIHRGDNRSSFHIDRSGRNWFCHGGQKCGGGDVIALIRVLDGLNFVDACTALGAVVTDAKPAGRTSARPTPTPAPPPPPPLPDLDITKHKEMREMWQRLADDRRLIEGIAASRDWEPSTIQALSLPCSTSEHGALGWKDGNSPDTGFLCFLFPRAVKTRKLFRDSSAPGGWRWHRPDGSKYTRWCWEGWPWNARELWREDRLATMPIARDSCLLVEGEPDAIAAFDDFGETTWRAVVAIPSASIGTEIKKRLPAVLHGLDVVFSQDADDAGEEAFNTLAELLLGSARSFSKLAPLRAA